MTSLSRRELLKQSVAATTAAAIGLPVSEAARAQGAAAEQGWQWDKAVCRFCGTGCGIQVATKDGKVVATKGDPAAPVNKGLNCIKGYFNGKILYGADRLTQPLLRMKDGKFDKNGDFTPVSWSAALDEMERQFRKAYNEKGPAGVSIIGSGQYTIQEGYAASKLMKAGFRSNNLDPNARHCMASAVVAFMQVFGIDEPANVYDDIELADTMVLWGANMAEAHPILWSRITDRKLAAKATRLVNITTYSNMSSDIADLEIVMKPNADLAIQNYLAREIIARNAVNWDFVNKHCVFATGPTDIGYGMRPTSKFAFDAEKDTQAKELEITLDRHEAVAQRRKAGEKVKQASRTSAGRHWLISFEEFKRGVEPYTLDFVAELAKGDVDEPLEKFKAKLRELADLYIDAGRNTLSFWTMGFNQHQRGVWVNEQCYTNHLLLGKHARPGNGAFSLTGQPSACGTAREVGTFAHRLPADMVVDNPAHRALSEKLWGLPGKTLNPKVGADHVAILRGLEDGDIGFLWVQVTNPFQSSPNINHYIKGARDKNNFIVVADCYPTLSGKVADLILPAAMIFEKFGGYGNAERRTQHWRQQVDPPGQARTDVWMMLEFAKRFKLAEVWGEKKLPGLKADGFNDNTLPDVLAEAEKMGYRRDMTLYDVLFARPENKKFAWPDPIAKGHNNATVAALGENWFVEKALFEEYRQFTVGKQHDLAPYDVYLRDDVRGLRWPVVQNAAGQWQETKYRFIEGHDPYVKKGEGFNFYGPAFKALPTGTLDDVTDTKPTAFPGKAKIFFRPYAAPVEQPDANYDLWLTSGRILEHWHTGSMTRRVPELHRAAPTAVLYMHADDARKRGLKRNDIAWIESRRGKVKMVVETQGRNRMPKGSVFVAFFDEAVLVNKLILDALDPISREPDFKKCACKVYKA
ncbi:MAG: nitrate reductase catalytic subunit NapA [Burkholderiaceae bacterium]|nr:nitrate reductase catalytic subunit NapA [Burkholderiaceae bacterium]